jgi:hypothetical protein
MNDEAVADLLRIAPGPVGPGRFRERKDDGLFGRGSLTWLLRETLAKAAAHPYGRAK